MLVKATVDIIIDGCKHQVCTTNNVASLMYSVTIETRIVFELGVSAMGKFVQLALQTILAGVQDVDLHKWHL